LLVPPDDISSSYFYRRCALFENDPDGSGECLRYAPAVMDVLKITPPFFYSYQCGSTLLTSYIPVHMYSMSLHIFFTVVTLIIIFSTSNLENYPSWWLALFPGVCWPHSQSIRDSTILIEPYQIICRAMNNIILLLSFGLCSPILCVYITLAISVYFCGWLMLIGRFVSVRMADLHVSASSPSTDKGSWNFSFQHSPDVEASQNDHRTIDDPLLDLLNQQLHGVNSSLMVCKWPVTLTSCFFMTLLCWDMAGDKGGWSQALWVPIVGVVMVFVILFSDWMQLSRVDHQRSAHGFFLFSLCSSHCHPQPHSDHNPNTVAHSLEFVRSSLHQTPAASPDHQL
jgi:hypothetical protein